MSTAPTGYQTPKTDWKAGDDAPVASGFNRIESNINAIETGSRTLNDGLASPANSGTLRQILSWFAGRLKAITGKSNWYTAPTKTLEDVNTHISATTPHTGVLDLAGTRTMTGNLTLKNADPTNDNHAARKKYVDEIAVEAEQVSFVLGTHAVPQGDFHYDIPYTTPHKRFAIVYVRFHSDYGHSKPDGRFSAIAVPDETFKFGIGRMHNYNSELWLAPLTGPDSVLFFYQDSAIMSIVSCWLDTTNSNIRVTIHNYSTYNMTSTQITAWVY